MAARVDRHWARFFGIDVARLSRPGVHVAPHAGLGDYAGVWLFRRGASCVVSAPPARVGEIEARLAGRSVAELGDPTTVAALFPEASRIVGPAFQASVAPDCFVARGDPETRLLDERDDEARARLREACSDEDWEFGTPPGATAIVQAGCFRAGALVSLATLRKRDGDACDPCIVSHPAWRGRGCATATVSAVVRYALERDLLVLYQTLVANEPAVALARALGFDPYATHLAVRLGGRS